LLHLLGYSVNIGKLTQTGLFGKQILSTKERYYAALAVVLLQTLINKTGKKGKKIFQFAKNLIDNSPSTALTLIDQIECPKKNENLYFYFIQCIVWSNQEFKKLGGEYTMKDLLEDAKFFAENIPKFCWNKEDYGKKLSKHLITKPISDFMSETIVGRDFDEAMAKFMTNLKDTISSKDMADTGNATDIESLKLFIEKSKGKLQKYFNLKTENITNFIRVKNALNSAIYTFKRYPKLSEVNFNE